MSWKLEFTWICEAQGHYTITVLPEVEGDEEELEEGWDAID
jgi:hypothetical protein